jgi:hypothetical protein
MYKFIFISNTSFNETELSYVLQRTVNVWTNITSLLIGLHMFYGTQIYGHTNIITASSLYET